MRKKFYAWLWKKLYMRVKDLQKAYFRLGNASKHHDCIKLLNILDRLQNELITGEAE